MEFDPKNELAKLLIANNSPLAKLLIGWPAQPPPPPPRNWLAEVMADQYFGGPFETPPPRPRNWLAELMAEQYLSGLFRTPGSFGNLDGPFGSFGLPEADETEGVR